MVVAPKETYGPGLQHVHVVLPVELHALYFADVVGMGDHKAPAGAVFHALVTAKERRLWVPGRRTDTIITQ